MIQPIGKGEDKIGFLSMDFEKLAQEVSAVNDKYNAPKAEKELVVTRRNSGNMYSQKNQNKIAFLDGKIDTAPEKVVDNSPIDSPTNKLATRFDPNNRLHTEKAVARLSSSEGITDIGGPVKYMKSESAPSIWDNDKLQNLAKQADSRDVIRQEKEATIERSKSMRQEGVDNLVKALADVDQRKASNISPAGDQIVSEDSARFTKVTRNISIFDVMEQKPEFARLAEKTLGEKMSEEKAKKSAEKDNSWKNGGKVVSSKDATNRLFDTLNKNKE